MKDKLFIILPILFVLLTIFWFSNSKPNEILLVENYLRANIKSITPEKPILGGQWYVVSVDVNETDKSGEVVYEDGHIQGKADFNYEIVGGGVQIKNFTVKPVNDEPVFCTQDAMMCPDGSYVGRTGPKCEFVCPSSFEKNSGYITGHVSIGPFCPVERIDNPCTTPPEAYTSRDVVVYEKNGITIKTKIKLDTEGNYRIGLTSGTYWLQIQPAGIGPGEKKEVNVVSGKTVTVDFDIDTGIR